MTIREIKKATAEEFQASASLRSLVLGIADEIELIVDGFAEDVRELPLYGIDFS